ncbi:MBL fold metallo-hydrolase [Bradyrhizobium paxllaeri]|uniref:MBL fold metallo-hydrolase n=1 Tax=Bradyrhizobium paxllaeri TaxID=190148 RepID=UPI0009FDA63D
MSISNGRAPLNFTSDGSLQAHSATLLASDETTHEFADQGSSDQIRVRAPKTWPVSDHFDGQRFHNPTLPTGFAPTFSSAMKMIFDKRSRWPAAVENASVPRLRAMCGTNDIAITFVNHATFLIQCKGLNILTDPIWSMRASPIQWLGPKRVREPGMAIDDLPRIDLILISHNHYDHLDIGTLRCLQQKFSPIVLVAAGDGELVRSIGFTNICEFDWWEELQIRPGCKVTFAPTQHFSARGIRDRQRSLWGSYLIQDGDRRVYFGGDGGYSTHFSDIKRRLGTPDVAMLGIGAYEPRWFMSPMHMNPAEAVQAHQDLGATQSIGMHHGTFQMSAEAIDRPLVDLAAAIRMAGIDETSFITLREGETRIYRAN